MTLPIERFKDSYKNWRYNPFTAADMAVDKEEDGLYVPSGSPFFVQLLEVPRKNTPTSVSVRCYGVKTDVDQDSALGQKVLYVASTTGFSATDKIIIDRGGTREEEGVIDTIQAGISLTLVDNLTYTHTAAQEDDVEKYIEFTEVGTAPTQSQYRVDYPPDDGEGTGLVEFNQNDANKEIRVNYKATGSPTLEEFLNTKISYPAGDPVDNQIIGFVSGAPGWRNNPIRYFHEGSVIYNTLGEEQSCLLFRFKRGADEQKVYLELKGARLFRGFYSELREHNHGVGTLSIPAASNHTHAVGTLVVSTEDNHNHGVGTLVNAGAPNHAHGFGTLAGTQPNHAHGLTGSTASGGTLHTHVINNRSHAHDNIVAGTEMSAAEDGCSSPTGVPSAGHTHAKGTLAVSADGNDAVTISGSTASTGSHNHVISGSVAAGGSHNHTLSGNTGGKGAHDHIISGSTANEGVTAKTYPDQLKIYINDVDKTTEVLALTGLTQFGNGAAGHAFVTTGSGEMDISSLVAAAQIHELKITEPISGEGGRCLLHLELI